MVTTKIWEALRRPEDVVLSPVKIIRKHCVECMGGQYKEIEACTSPKCWLFPYRLGTDPRRRKRTDKQIQAAKQSLAKARSQKAP